MQAGRLKFRVTFKRRAVISPRERSDDYRDRFLVDWPADYQRQNGREALEAGRPVDVEQGILSVRESTETRQITSADRVEIEGRDHAITSVSLPNRRTRRIDLVVSTSLGG